jgi:tRNA modification GTPase
MVHHESCGAQSAGKKSAVNMFHHDTDTIAAPASAVGRAGIGITRISGPDVKKYAINLLGKLPKPRVACYAAFLDQHQKAIDNGIALFFPAPHSFTGEDVLELHGHGGAVVMDLLLQRILSLGARMARPGEFSERAFLNNKMDLTQAEAIADLIDAGSAQAARAALQSLEGVFSQRIHDLVEKLIALRIYVEAAMDFPEEEIDFLNDGHVVLRLQNILEEIHAIQKTATQGAILREGMVVVIAGSPNAGKSSLLNQLSGRDSAIVTAIPGTTRDVVREHIQLDGLPLQVIDTAGLRDSNDLVEQEGIKRAHDIINKADRVLYLIDVTVQEKRQDIVFNHPRVTIIQNKIDLISEKPEFIEHKNNKPIIKLSAKTGEGIDLLKKHLKACMGFSETTETKFSARRRHLDALARANKAIELGQAQLQEQKAGELLAEELRVAQQALSEITGEFSNDDLLGKIFQNFCIGK